MKAVIFDMDGVISDTQTLAANVESKIFRKYGLDIAPEYCTQVYAGTAHHYMYEKEFAKAGITADIDKTVEETWGILLNSKDMVKPIEGIYQVIEILKKNNYKIAVASASVYPFIEMVLSGLDLKEQFDIIVSAEDPEVKHGKPDPDVFLLAAKRLNIEPYECIVIEDGINGMMAAKTAGMKCIGLVQDQTKKYPADIIVTSLKQLTIKDFR